MYYEPDTILGIWDTNIKSMKQSILKRNFYSDWGKGVDHAMVREKGWPYPGESSLRGP